MMPQMLENTANPAEAHTENSSSRRSRRCLARGHGAGYSHGGLGRDRVSPESATCSSGWPTALWTGSSLDGVRSLLDVGCGDGRITAEIARRIPEADVVGLDPSPRMISIAPAGGRLSFELGDVRTMTYAGSGSTLWCPSTPRTGFWISALRSAGSPRPCDRPAGRCSCSSVPVSGPASRSVAMQVVRTR